MTRFSRTYAAILADRQDAARRAKIDAASRPPESVRRKAAAEPPSGETPGVTARSKYGNTITNGYHSKREADHAAYLQIQERSGIIRNLREQVKYLLIPKQDGERECSYVCDFQYEQKSVKTNEWETVVVDVKGFRTPEYILKRKLLLFVHKIRVREV
jgi:hypothetical protein